MVKRNSEVRKAMLLNRRIIQVNRLPTKAVKVRGKYVPAGERKNVK